MNLVPHSVPASNICSTRSTIMQNEMQDFLFDLRGYLILKNAVEPQHVRELNAAIDSFPKLEWGQWHGNVQRFDNNGDAGVELQNIVEAGQHAERPTQS